MSTPSRPFLAHLLALLLLVPALGRGDDPAGAPPVGGARAWLREGGLSPAAAELVGLLALADREGLRPDDYPLDRLLALLAGAAQGAGDPAALESALGEAFLAFATHHERGRLDPDTLERVPLAEPSEGARAALAAVAVGGRSVAAVLRALDPPAPGFARLRGALGRHLALASGAGWPRVEDGALLRAGERSRRVPTLRARLAATGELASPQAADPNLFDPDLEAALRVFQARHGLKVDGILGPDSLQALNTPAAERALQIALNLERWRWLPRDLGRRHILANIPDFSLQAVEDGEVRARMRTIVGRTDWPTPTFADAITHLIFNPYWDVPPRIGRREVLPQVLADPAYLAAHEMDVVRGFGAAVEYLDSASIDWQALNGRGLPFRFRQRPGAQNPLGRVKFLFPNGYNVYLHDTPFGHLFERAERDLSHGCVRVQDPAALAVFLLDGDAWSRDGVLAAIGEGETRRVDLAEPVAVHLIYRTAWVDEDGTVQFRRDVYGRDARLAAAW